MQTFIRFVVEYQRFKEPKPYWMAAWVDPYHDTLESATERLKRSDADTYRIVKETTTREIVG